jgi:hypothetical protein
MDYINHTDIAGSDLEAVLFRSDILAPHEYWQVHRPNHFRQPEIELMRAVLEDALHCFFTNVQMRGRRQKRIFTETEEWFFGTENEARTSHLKISPHCLASTRITRQAWTCAV